MAGLPAATQYGGTSCVTTLFAPMIAPLPILTEESMQTLFPFQTFFNMNVTFSINSSFLKEYFYFFVLNFAFTISFMINFSL